MRTQTRAGVAAIAVAATMALPVAAAPPAQAADWGGDGNPVLCTDAYTVAQAPIYGTRGPVKGILLGWVQLRWSNRCWANWSRVVLQGTGAYSNRVTVEQRIEAEGRSAGANDTVRPLLNGSITWTPYLRLKSNLSVACAYGTLSSDFGTLNYHTVGGHVCG